MALELQLNPLTVPFGTEFPGTVQELLELIAQYEEITGSENFNGVNYGSVEPDPADRDKAWLRTDESGEFLGWYVWDGAQWSILPAKAFVGTMAEREAIAEPQDGYLFHVVGTGISTFVESLNTWEWGFPEANQDLVGDKFYFFSSAQLMVSVGGAVPSWSSLDISSLIASSGISPDNISALIVRMDASLGPVGFGGGVSYQVAVRTWGSDLVSTGATDVGYLSVVATRDDSNTSASGTTQAFIPIGPDPEEFFYNVQQVNSPPGLAAAVWLVGFIYTPSAT